jgi:AraC family transcriptional regulator
MSLVLCLTTALLKQAAADLGGDPDRVAVRPAIQLRDARIENIAWAIKAELESTAPSNRLYAESLATGLSVRLIEGLDQAPRAAFGNGQTLSATRRDRLIEYIESHIEQSLSLADLAGVAGLSLSHFNTLFRHTFGMPAHQYVMRRRVERAKSLLLSGGLSLNEVATAAGFADQSHMGRRMRLVLGLTPSALVKLRG